MIYASINCVTHLSECVFCNYLIISEIKLPNSFLGFEVFLNTVAVIFFFWLLLGLFDVINDFLLPCVFCLEG